MFELTIKCKTLDELKAAIDKLEGKKSTPDVMCSASPAPDYSFVSGMALDTYTWETRALVESARLEAVKIEHRKPEPVHKPEPVCALEDVKNFVFQLAKEKGRDVSLDLLSEFGATYGQGADRGGKISLIPETEYATVIARAKQMLRS